MKADSAARDAAFVRVHPWRRSHPAPWPLHPLFFFASRISLIAHKGGISGAEDNEGGGGSDVRAQHLPVEAPPPVGQQPMLLVDNGVDWKGAGLEGPQRGRMRRRSYFLNEDLKLKLPAATRPPGFVSFIKLSASEATVT